jgi:predicted amidohydrolase YtcJ
MKLLFVLATFLPAFTFSQNKTTVDLVVYNTRIYTVDARFSTAEAMAVDKGRIVATGSSNTILKQYAGRQQQDLKGRFVYPGFIDAHAHFFNYGMELNKVDLTGTNSWDSCLARVTAFVKTKNITPGKWITGRGWDQNDWNEKSFPDKTALDALFPDNPILLTRIDGHAAIANSAALKKAGVQPGQTLIGGDVEVKNGTLTGILIDNAVDLVSDKIPGATMAEMRRGLLDAQERCFAAGLTTIDDCGLPFMTLGMIEKMQQEGSLKMRLYIMLSDAPANFNYLIKRGPIQTERLTVRSFKVYADGALGSRGACLLEPYHDKPGHMGFLLSQPEHFDSVAALIYKHGFQMCTHAIGDSGNRSILNIYGKYLKGKNDLRWRIEHAQVVNKADFGLFGRYGIIPSIQPTHATSDMYWAGDRLGKEREKGAYAWKYLLRQNGWLPLGTDFPVEDISPLKTFYAATIRKDAKGWPAKGYQPENALNRMETLRGMTIWAARSNFEETVKGSLEKGKMADFVVLNTDLMACKPEQILQTVVVSTFVNGEAVFTIR